MTAKMMEPLVEAIVIGDCTQSLDLARNLCDTGISAKEIVVNGIEVAMAQLDEKCTMEQFNLLEIMLTGRAAMEVMKYLFPSGEMVTARKGTIVLAVLEGDVHDIGKNILKMILIANGYQVVDCGKNCPIERLLDVIEKEKPLAIGLSGLIFPVIPMVKQVKEQMQARGIYVPKIMVGGAALKQSSMENLNVDFLAETAFDSVNYLEQLSGGESNE
ncbi:cobalamin B12-binding domain-containing protein [Acetobacterium tundrae]|nr:cobalamin-dependent protein [Acetobacterium tundrae]